MKPHEFFQELLKSRGTNSNAVAVALNRPKLQGTLNRFENGKTANPRNDWVVPVAKFFDIAPDALRSEETATEWAAKLGLTAGAASAPPSAVNRPKQARIDAGALALQIGDLMRDHDQTVRAAAAALFSGAALKPDDAASIAQRLRGLLQLPPI